MRKRRKRRSAEDIEQSIIDAATTLILEDGFGNLTATGIMQKAEIEPVQFYRRYKDLDNFIDEYVKNYDYWFNNIVKSSTLSTNLKEEYNSILCNLLKSLWTNKIMQELLRWEVATKNETSCRTAQLRELHTLPLCRKFANEFKESDADIVAISALLIGGIYYMVLHNDLSDFSGINFKNEKDIERITKTIQYLSDLLFKSPSSFSAIKAATAMKKDGLPLDKIVEYTNLPLQFIKEL